MGGMAHFVILDSPYIGMGYPKLFSFFSFSFQVKYVSLNCIGVKSVWGEGTYPAAKIKSWDEDVESHFAKLGSSRQNSVGAHEILCSLHEDFCTLLTLARSGGLMQPPMSFSELDATPFG